MWLRDIGTDRHRRERERVRVTGRQTGGEGRRGRERDTHRAMSQLCEGSGGKKVRRKKEREKRMEGDQRVFISPREV